MHGGHPSAPARQSLAMQVGMTPKSVQVWFQNRRQKLRAMNPQTTSRPSSSLLLGSGPQHPSSAGVPASRGTAGSDPAASAPEASAQLASLAKPLTRTASESSTPLEDDAEPLSRAVPRHLVSELASVASAEHELLVLAAHLTQRKAQLLATIAQHEAASSSDEELSEEPPIADMPTAHPSPPPGSLSPPYASASPTPERPSCEAPGRPLCGAAPDSHTSSPRAEWHMDPHQGARHVEVAETSAALSGLDLLSSMATHFNFSAAAPVSAT